VYLIVVSLSNGRCILGRQEHTRGNVKGRKGPEEGRTTQWSLPLGGQPTSSYKDTRASHERHLRKTVNDLGRESRGGHCVIPFQ
jgi:hypothetical protein